LRGSPRTNLLLTASIEFGGATADVRIRNVSETGALVEGPHVPNKGARLFLARSNFKIGATVAWTSGGKAGLRFDEPLPVSAWAGGKPKPVEPAGLRDQRQVDAVQAAIRAGRSLAPQETDASASALEGQLNARISDEIKYVARLIESMGDQLAGDPVILHKHAKSLQNIDLANQILSHLADIVTADDPAARVAEIGMTDLRARLTRRSLT
jgi:hypothetical protein